MEFCELTEKEFTKFVNGRPEKNFFQTVMMKHKLEKDGHKVYLVGVKEKKEVIAASLIAETGSSFMGKKTFEAYKGFILDYSNQKLLEFLSCNVKQFLKAKGALNLYIDPYIPNVSRDMDANITEDIDNRYIRNNLEKLGYKYNKNGTQVKWCYCLDINGKNSDELLNGFRSSTRNYINRTITKYKLNLRTLSKEQLSEFKKVTSDTCIRRGFPDKSLEYYENMYECFGDKVVFKICELNCDEYISVLEQENKSFKSKLDELSDSSSNKKKKEVMKSDIANNQKKIEETKKLKETNGNIIPLSAAMFMLYGDEIVYLFSGSYDEYMSFCGQYRIQWDIIKYAADNHYRRYNFYGIKDVFNPKGKDYGVYEFKKGFGGYVEELLGSFELTISKYNYFYKFLRGLKRIVKK